MLKKEKIAVKKSKNFCNKKYINMKEIVSFKLYLTFF